VPSGVATKSDLANSRQENLVTGLGTRRATQIWFFAPILSSGPREVDIAGVLGSALDEVSSCTPTNALSAGFDMRAGKDSVGQPWGTAYGLHNPGQPERRSKSVSPGGSIEEAILHWNHPWDNGVNVYVAKYEDSADQTVAAHLIAEAPELSTLSSKSAASAAEVNRHAKS
jgi:hypothetical protein